MFLLLGNGIRNGEPGPMTTSEFAGAASATAIPGTKPPAATDSAAVSVATFFELAIVCDTPFLYRKLVPLSVLGTPLQSSPKMEPRVKFSVEEPFIRLHGTRITHQKVCSTAMQEPEPSALDDSGSLNGSGVIFVRFSDWC